VKGQGGFQCRQKCRLGWPTSGLGSNQTAQRYQDETDRIVNNGLSVISNPRLRDRVQSDIAAPLAQERAAIKDQAFRGAAAAHATNREDFLHGLIENLTLNPKDAVITGGIDAYGTLVDNAVGHGFLTPDAATADKRRAALALCAGEYALMARRDPERAIRELESPETGHPLLVHLPQEQRDALHAQAEIKQLTNKVDARDAERLRQQQAQRASDEAQAAIIKDRFSNNPTITADAIANNKALLPQAMQRLLRLVDRQNEPEPSPEVSSATAIALLDRIRREDGDQARSPMSVLFSTHTTTAN
jgi:hypothetical protein